MLRETQNPSDTVELIIRGVRLTVELAETPADQQKGLSGRGSMPADRGMLFIFKSESKWQFWMKDMRFSLDIIWFDSNRSAVYILENVPPCSQEQCPLYTPAASALYVLEVNAGFVQTHEVSLADTFVIIS